MRAITRASSLSGLWARRWTTPPRASPQRSCNSAIGDADHAKGDPSSATPIVSFMSGTGGAHQTRGRTAEQAPGDHQGPSPVTAIQIVTRNVYTTQRLRTLTVTSPPHHLRPCMAHRAWLVLPTSLTEAQPQRRRLVEEQKVSAGVLLSAAAAAAAAAAHRRRHHRTPHTAAAAAAAASPAADVSRCHPALCQQQSPAHPPARP